MPERSTSSIAFTLLLNVYFFGLAERPVKASPLQWQDRGHYREAKLNRPLGQASGFSLFSAEAAGVEITNRLAHVRMVNGSSGRYSRNSDTQILGAAKRIRSVEVTWPSGIKAVEQVTNPALLLELGL